MGNEEEVSRGVCLNVSESRRRLMCMGRCVPFGCSLLRVERQIHGRTENLENHGHAENICKYLKLHIRVSEKIFYIHSVAIIT